MTSQYPAGSTDRASPSDDDFWSVEAPANPLNLPESSLGLRGACGRIFACACGAGGGFLAGHAGCAASYAMTFSSIGLSGLYSASGAALAGSAALAAGGIGLWYRLRGKIAGIWERRVTFGGAATGVLVSLSMHFASAGGHVAMAESALDYYRALPPEQQKTFRAMPVLLEKLCRSPDAPSSNPR